MTHPPVPVAPAAGREPGRARRLVVRARGMAVAVVVGVSCAVVPPVAESTHAARGAAQQVGSCGPQVSAIAWTVRSTDVRESRTAQTRSTARMQATVRVTGRWRAAGRTPSCRRANVSGTSRTTVVTSVRIATKGRNARTLARALTDQTRTRAWAKARRTLAKQARQAAVRRLGGGTGTSGSGVGGGSVGGGISETNPAHGGPKGSPPKGHPGKK